MTHDDWLEIAGLMPPLPKDISQALFANRSGDSAGSHTFVPALVTKEDFENTILPKLRQVAPQELTDFIVDRVNATFALRKTLAKLKDRIEGIVGQGNFSALWLDREAFSSDSMEHRALVTEAVVTVYSPSALQQLVTLFYQNGVPMIPYGEGGGYNMGVTPMAPAVTISLRGIDHISYITPCHNQPDKFQISVGAGLPFKDLQAYVRKRGFVLRCDPNTPRAATGGIVATGSNAGRKAWEVITRGRAITLNGTVVPFYRDTTEANEINQEPFLMARKFFSVKSPTEFAKTLSKIQQLALTPETSNASSKIHIPLVGTKAGANMAAQKQGYFATNGKFAELAKGAIKKQISNTQEPQTDIKNSNKVTWDEIFDPTSGAYIGKEPWYLPISAFVGAEGTTGFIYEVTFELEKPKPFLQAARWHFDSVAQAMQATRKVKQLPLHQQPFFFEIVTGASIRKYLLQDFPKVFAKTDEAVLFLAVEGDSEENCTNAMQSCFNAASGSANFTSHFVTAVMDTAKSTDEFELLRKPREELPKRLKTKCKTDMEIRTEFLPQVLEIIASANPKKFATQKQDVLFGHLTPRHTAIMHWNIGGFDLYDEEQADAAWEYLERVVSTSASLAPKDDPFGSAQFTGEHGVAGKAPFLWINHIPAEDYSRMCQVKEALDPKGLFNPETLFLRTSLARSLRARLLNSSQSLLVKYRSTEALPAEKLAIEEALRCTRCNACKTCPVIDAEHELEREGKRNSKQSVLPSKRNILLFMERVALWRHSEAIKGDRLSLAKVERTTNAMLKEAASLLKKCFYCRKCDKACPVDINIHPLMRAYAELGKLPTLGSKFWLFIYERLMGEDRFKALTYKFLACLFFFQEPLFAFLRKLTFIPDWLKTYTAPPQLSFAHYEPLQQGSKQQSTDTYVVVGATDNNWLAEERIYVRYRGCMDTFGRPTATSTVDKYFNSILNAPVVDLEKKLCCGFPFEADGLHERALQSQLTSVVEIAASFATLMVRAKEQHPTQPLPKFTVFSNCPTCCEALREMRTMLSNPDYAPIIRSRAKIDQSIALTDFDFEVKDTVEVALEIRGQRAAQNHFQQAKLSKAVGLKVPCHNTPAATRAQLALLNEHYSNVAPYDRCCGLSGTGRIKHPKIGTKISEKLFEQIREHQPAVVVSGCPSCRDGVEIQRKILSAREDPIAEFNSAGIFEQIVADFHGQGQNPAPG